MDELKITLDTSALAKLGDQFGASEKQGAVALARAINHTGDKAKTKMAGALVPQTGLKKGVILRALRTTKASPGKIAYVIKTRGGNVRLKHFEPRETAKGVSAAPWSKRFVQPGSFMKAGWWPRRVIKPNWNGQVMERVGSKTETIKSDGRYMDRFEVVRSGLFIPTEMKKGASAEAFNKSVDTDLENRLLHELSFLLGKK